MLHSLDDLVSKTGTSAVWPRFANKPLEIREVRPDYRRRQLSIILTQFDDVARGLECASRSYADCSLQVEGLKVLRISRVDLRQITPLRRIWTEKLIIRSPWDKARLCARSGCRILELMTIKRCCENTEIYYPWNQVKNISWTSICMTFSSTNVYKEFDKDLLKFSDLFNQNKKCILADFCASFVL